MEDDTTAKMRCHYCDYVGRAEESDGYYYCQQCGTQAPDIMDTGVDVEDLVDKGGDPRGGIYQASNRRSQVFTPAKPVSQSQFWSQLSTQKEPPVAEDHYQTNRQFEENYDAVGPTGPEDFGSPGVVGTGLAYKDYYTEVRNRYIMGVQIMIQRQCEALIKEFKVVPLICGITGPCWLRYVALSGVLNDDWADETIQESEKAHGEASSPKRPTKHKEEPHNLIGGRAVTIWLMALKKSIPLSASLAISFLACHVAREAILPSDIVNWASEGKIPYISAFVDIAKQMGDSSPACPIKASVMFSPNYVCSAQKLEVLAASIARTVGLSLPPVNFNGIALRYLKQLNLPSDKIFPHARKINEWAMPPELYLSRNEGRLPTRVCVMSILIVTIRILYNIHGFGVWEQSLSSSSCSDDGSNIKGAVSEGAASPPCSTDDVETNPAKTSLDNNNSLQPEFDAEELLKNLEAIYFDMGCREGCSKDLETYKQFCKDVVFAGEDKSYMDNEFKFIEELQKFNEREESYEPQERHENQQGSPFIENRQASEDKKSNDGDPSSQTSDIKARADRAIRQLKADMDENRFCYIPPRTKVKKLDYVHYVRKRDDGAMTYVAHADYYILLRVCAKLAQVDMRNLQLGVLSLERRLAWLEKRIDHCLRIDPPIVTCQYCSDLPGGEEEKDVEDDLNKFSSLNL